MSETQSRAYYDDFATHYEAERHDGYHRWLDERSVGLVADLALSSRVLEVGCGTGLILREVDPLAAHAVGVDLSHGMLDVARQRNLRVVEGSADALPFADGAFDLVYSFKVLAHVPNLPRALEEMARVTRPGGHLVLEFYNRHSLRYAIRRLRRDGRIGDDKTEADVYTRFHSLSELKAMLPSTVALIRTEGLRVATVLPRLFRVPFVGGAWARLEDTLSASPLHRAAGFLVLVLQRR